MSDYIGLIEKRLRDRYDALAAHEEELNAERKHGLAAAYSLIKQREAEKSLAELAEAILFDLDFGEDARCAINEILRSACCSSEIIEIIESLTQDKSQK
jgi:hypothetical protein